MPLNLFYNNHTFFAEIGLLVYYTSICCICTVYKFRALTSSFGTWTKAVKIGLSATLQVNWEILSKLENRLGFWCSVINCTSVL